MDKCEFPKIVPFWDGQFVFDLRRIGGGNPDNWLQGVLVGTVERYGVYAVREDEGRTSFWCVEPGALRGGCTSTSTDFHERHSWNIHNCRTPHEESDIITAFLKSGQRIDFLRKFISSKLK